MSRAPYMRRYRKTSKRYLETLRARGRALTRLRQAHEKEYRRFYLEEIAKEPGGLRPVGRPKAEAS